MGMKQNGKYQLMLTVRLLKNASNMFQSHSRNVIHRKQNEMPKTRKITEFNRSECRRLGDAIEKAVAEVGRKHGVHIKRGNARYSSSNVTYKMEASLLGQNGEVKNKEAEDFKMYASHFGLEAKDLGKPFTSFNGKVFTICGLNMRARKNPIHAKNIRWKVFVFPAEEVKALLTRG